MKMKTVLFVCTGNTCRSPMAEALFIHRTEDRKEWKACSAGVHADAGTRPSRQAIEVMRELGIDITGHRSRPLTAEHLRDAELIVTMTASHRFEILQNFPEVENRVFLIKSFGTSKVPCDITDPFGGSVDLYRKTRDEIDRAVSDLVFFIHAGNKQKN
jgi:protein-tyrosine-phosphatase